MTLRVKIIKMEIIRKKKITTLLLNPLLQVIQTEVVGILTVGAIIPPVTLITVIAITVHKIRMIVRKVKKAKKL